MSYCTEDDMIDRFGEAEIIELTRGDGDVDAAVLELAIADADAEIDGYLASVTLVPAPTNPNLTRIGCDITRYRLYDERATEQTRERYRDAVRYLERVATGQMALTHETTESGSTLTIEGSEPVFSMENLDGF